MKPRITIRLFGRLSVHCDDQELLVHTSSRAKEILCYLILSRRTPVRRERLAAIISGDPHPDRSRKALRHALWQLRADLFFDLGPLHERVLRVEHEWIQFHPGDGVWLDLAEFEAAAKDPQRAAHAIGLYREELLQGWDQDWCVEERERLRQIYLETLDTLIALSEADGDTKSGVAHGLLALHNDPSREWTHRALMRLYAAHGDRHSALEQYQQCLSALRELGLLPDDQTKALVQRIREGHVLQVETDVPSLRPVTRLSTPPKAARARDTPQK
jgi:DNA-binding SARP family transcriptional activator